MPLKYLRLTPKTSKVIQTSSCIIFFPLTVGKTQKYPWFPYWSQQTSVFLIDECEDSTKFSLEANSVIIVCLDVKSFDIEAYHTVLVNFCCFSGYKNDEILRGEVGKTLRFLLFSKRKKLYFSEGSCRVKKCFCAKKQV